VEVGFHYLPVELRSSAPSAPETALIEDGDIRIKVTWRYENARGELDRSTTATTATVTMAGGTRQARGHAVV
jgi:hypothetical protein